MFMLCSRVRLPFNKPSSEESDCRMRVQTKSIGGICGALLPSRSVRSFVLRTILALAFGSIVPAGSAQAMPDDAWCTSVSDALRSSQVDRDGLVRRVAAQHDWARVRRLFLLDWPFPADLRGPDRDRALHEYRSAQLLVASARGDMRAVNELLAAGADPNVEGTVDYIATPLALAALCDRPAVALRLIRGGARVNYRFHYSNNTASHEGTTALMWAAMGGSLRVTRLLLERGARADLRESYFMHGSPPRRTGATALEISTSTDFPTSRAIQRMLRARVRRR